MARARGQKAAAPTVIALRLVRSPIGYAENQKITVRSLGLRRLNQVIVHDDTPQMRGMVAKVSHLVKIVDRED